MSRIPGKNTNPEKIIFALLKEKGYKFRKHAKHLPGKPDIIFSQQKIAIFIDGEFWHGRKFSQWKDKLSSFWLKKISGNIKRDKKNILLLKLKGWKVLRIWDKQITKQPEKALRKLIKAVGKIYFD